MRLDVLEPEGAGDRHAVVAVADEVRLADAVDLDRGQRLAAARRRCDALPARAHPRGRRAKRAIEAGGAVDGADDRRDRDHLDAQVALAGAPERRDDLVEWQDEVEVSGPAYRARSQPRHRLAPAGPQEVVLGVGGMEARGARRHATSCTPLAGSCPIVPGVVHDGQCRSQTDHAAALARRGQPL